MVKIIMLDTNIYGWYLSYTLKGDRKPEATSSFNLVSKILEKKSEIEVLASKTIEGEIKNAKSSELSRLFYSIVKGIIKTSKKINELAKGYFEECRKEKLHFVTIEDCEIVASATIAGVKLLVTENRKTLNNPQVKQIIRNVNSKRGLKDVGIKDSKSSIGEIYV